MDIVIPSKYIYDLSNPKVRDNVYKRLDVNAIQSRPNNRFDTNVAEYTESTEDLFGSLDSAEWIMDAKWNSVGVANGTRYNWATAIASARTIYTDFSTNIKKAVDNAYISKLKIEDASTEGLSIVLQCKKYVGEGIVNATNSSGHTVQINNQQITYSPTEEVVKTTFDDGSFIVEFDIVDDKVVAEVSLRDNKDVLISIANTDEHFKVDLNNIVAGWEVFSGSYGVAYDTTPLRTFDIPVQAFKYEPILLEISFEGNIIGIDFEKETVSIGAQASKNSLSIEGNELIQSTNIYYPPFNHYYDGNYEVIELQKIYSQRVKVQYIYNGTRGEQYISGGNSLRIYNPTPVPFEVVSVTFASNGFSEFYKNILDEYNNGKETATLTCTMSRYLDTNGEAVIDPAVYNVVDLNCFNGDGYSFNIDTDNGVIIMESHSTLDGVQMMTTYDGEPQVEQYADGRIYYKNYFTNKTKVGLRFTLHTTNREEDDYGITLDTSYLPDGNYSLSFELDIKDDVVTILNLQINKGKARPYQKPVRMHFSEGDIVIPMKYTSSGTDVGISLYNNNVNTPKQFKVTGVELFYDGVTRQKLTLQEV